MVSTSKGVFWLKQPSSDWLLTKVLPAVGARDGMLRLEHFDFGPLIEAGILESVGIDLGQLPVRPNSTRQIHAIRTTALSSRILSLLESHGFLKSPEMQSGDFILADLSNLPDIEACDLVEEINHSGCTSICFWKRGNEVFLGPISMPGATACWHCSRLRLADSLNDVIGAVEDDQAIANAVAINTTLACRYPEIAGFGCLLTIGHGQMLHSILPIPNCTTCGGKGETNRWAPLNHSFHVPERLRSLADPRVGIIRHIYLFEGKGHEAPSMPICASARMAPVPRRRAGAPGIIQGEGKGATQEDAVLSAIGEGVERYAASIWQDDQLVRKRLSEVHDRAFDPRWLVLYGAEQYARPGFPFTPPNPNLPLNWTIGRWLDTSQEVLLPAQATYLEFTEDNFLIAQSTSNGLATGQSFEDAALRAVYELVERDAFMMYWLAGRCGERIDLSSCDELCRYSMECVRHLGADTEMYVLDYGIGIPTILCLGLGDGVEWPGVTIGLGSHSDINVACRKAVLEHGHYGPYMRRLMKQRRHSGINNPEDVVGSLDHGLYYCRREPLFALDRLRQAKRSVTVADLSSKYRDQSTLDSCIARLSAAAIRVAVVDLTTPDLKPSGLSVVRAFGTYLQPIHFGYGYERRDNPRLKDLSTATLNDFPHPMA
jgi:ribosomal protein S12 methylthiotransferase accessory factor